jgi:hypothetical protein
MASISTFARNFAKGKNGQHSNFRNEFREFLVDAKAGVPRYSVPYLAIAEPILDAVTGYERRYITQSYREYWGSKVVH